jgi:hypothetical protein
MVDALRTEPRFVALLKRLRFVQSSPIAWQRRLRTGAASSASHPHILPLFDSGEADGFLYCRARCLDSMTSTAAHG